MGYVIKIFAVCERCRRILGGMEDGCSHDMFRSAHANLMAQMKRDKWIDRNMGYSPWQVYCSECADKPALTKREAAKLHETTKEIPNVPD